MQSKCLLGSPIPIETQCSPKSHWTDVEMDCEDAEAELCSEVTLLQSGSNSNSAGNACCWALQGVWREGFPSCLGSLKVMDEEEAESVTMREQWLFSSEIVPVNSESSFLCLCARLLVKREHFTHTLFHADFSQGLFCCSKHLVQADVFSALAVLAQASNFSNSFLKRVRVLNVRVGGVVTRSLIGRV